MGGEESHLYIQSRFYRSPEVLLGMPHNIAIDMWSLGCTLVEIHTGNPLFPGADEIDQMHQIVRILGLPPKHILDKAPATKKYFHRNRDGSYSLKPKKDGSLEPEKTTIDEVIGIRTGGPEGSQPRATKPLKSEYEKFKNLILRMLTLNPESRITPQEVLQHDFFRRTSLRRRC